MTDPKDRVMFGDVPQGLRRAQDVARSILDALEPLVVVGVSEVELEAHAERIAQERGCSGFWSPATTRVGLGTLVAHPDFPMQDRRAQAGDTVIIDIACTFEGWCGDHCRTFILEPQPETEELVADCEWVYQELRGYVRPGMPASELFARGEALLQARNLKLLDLLDNFGHSIGESFAADGFIDASNHTPMWGAWTLEPHVGRWSRGAKVEDIVWLASDGSVTEV